MSFNESKSFKNLEKSFEKGAIAILKYLLFANQARAEGREDIALLFDKIRNNEIEHAKLFYTTLYGNLKTTEENLQAVAQEENFEWKHYYPDAANIAKAEGFANIAEIFQRMSTIENAHEREVTEALLTYHNKNQKNICVQQKEEKQIKFACMLCGFTSEEMPVLCPVCNSDGPFITM